jgi:hypothetical protein
VGQISWNLFGQLALLAAIAAFFLWAVFKPKNPPPIVIPDLPDLPPGACIVPLGVQVRMGIIPSWWDPTKWGPEHYPAGSALCFIGLFDDCDPTDLIKPALFKWTVFGPFGPQPVWYGQSGAENSACWSGEMFIGGSCGDLNPKPYRVVCQIQLSNGEWLPNVEKTIWAVGERACR